MVMLIVIYSINSDSRIIIIVSDLSLYYEYIIICNVFFDFTIGN